jgi:hypothetical protein
MNKMPPVGKMFANREAEGVNTQDFEYEELDSRPRSTDQPSVYESFYKQSTQYDRDVPIKDETFNKCTTTYFNRDKAAYKKNCCNSILKQFLPTRKSRCKSIEIMENNNKFSMNKQGGRSKRRKHRSCKRKRRRTRTRTRKRHFIKKIKIIAQNN